MRKAFAIAAAVAAVGMTPSVAHAATEISIGTNGGWVITDSGGNVLQTRTPDNTEKPGTWVPSEPGSEWISPDIGDGISHPAQSSPAGLYNFKGFFDLSDVGNIQTWSLTWWADNIVRSILVNNVEIFANSGGSSQAQEFVSPGISRVFTNPVWINGANTVTFVVENGTGGNTGNPVGLKVSSVLSAVPEPGTWLLMILGLGAVGFAMRRRQSLSVRLQFA